MSLAIDDVPGCFLVASGRLGAGITSPWDGNSYLLIDGEDAKIIDAGSGLAHEQVLGRIMSVLGGRRVSGIYLTHGHADHAGGAAALAGSLDAPIFAHPVAVTRLAAADEIATGLARARAAGVYPAHLRMSPVAAIALPPGVIAFGAGTLEPVPTAGHSADHVVYLWTRGGRRILFSGDLVFAGGRIASQDLPDHDPDRLWDAIDRLGGTRLDTMLAGHGEPVTDGAAHLLRRAAVARRHSGIWKELE